MTLTLTTMDLLRKLLSEKSVMELNNISYILGTITTMVIQKTFSSRTVMTNQIGFSKQEFLAKILLNTSKYTMTTGAHHPMYSM